MICKIPEIVLTVPEPLSPLEIKAGLIPVGDWGGILKLLPLIVAFTTTGVPKPPKSAIKIELLVVDEVVTVTL